MGDFGQQSLTDFQRALAQKTSAPGGGAAAGVVAALGCALAAMSARYTSGKKYSEEAQKTAELLALQVDQAAVACLDFGERDALAYAQVQELRKAKAPQNDIKQAEMAARHVPLSLLKTLENQAKSVAAFKTLCNPWLLSDLRAALHLLAGAGAAAWEMLVAGDPPVRERNEGYELCESLNLLALNERSPKDKP